MDIQTQKKLDYLEETKQLLRAAIEEKGQTINDSDSFRSYVDKVRAIATGGGSAELRYVTFKDDTGTVEYGKKAVAEGDDCADPIVRGVFSTPTKASTAQYNYTFAGWATTPGGGIDSNALKAVNEDRTVYANFISALRYYTITYYDDDGVTVLNTESLAYGAMPSYSPFKEGFKLEGWNPSFDSVTGNASYVAQWRELSGLSLVTTISKATINTGNAKYFSINNDGTLLATAVAGEAKNKPLVYQIKDGINSLVSTGSISLNPKREWEYCGFEYDDAYFKMIGFSMNDGYKAYRFKTDGANIVSYERLNISLSSAYIAESPVADIYAYNDGLILNISNGTKINTNVIVKNNIFSPDGKHIAYCNNPVSIYRISDGALVKTLDNTSAPTKISYNADGSLMAISFSSAPYLKVYETKSYTEIADLSDRLSAATYAEFIGVDWLIVGSGNTVQAFEVTASGVEDFEYDLPEYTGGTIAGMAKNNSNKNLVLWDSSNIVVWSKI